MRKDFGQSSKSQHAAEQWTVDDEVAGLLPANGREIRGLDCDARIANADKEAATTSAASDSDPDGAGGASIYRSASAEDERFGTALTKPYCRDYAPIARHEAAPVTPDAPAGIDSAPFDAEPDEIGGSGNRGELNVAEPTDTTAAQHDQVDGSPDDLAPSSMSDEEPAVPRLSKLALESLLDELTAELVALEAFGREVDDRARENEWFGKHTELSQAVFRAELVRTGKYTFNVDENGVLLDDPVKYRLALEVGAQITLRVHRGLSEAKKSHFILLTQGRDRVRTEAENRELKRRIILAGLVQGLSYEAAGEMAGVHPNTVRNFEKRAAADPNSKLDITQRPDGRFKPETQEKIAEAAKLRKEGMKDADIAKIFDTDVESVGRWFKKASAPDKAKKAKPGKGKKIAATKPAQPIEDNAAGDGVLERHRRALKHLGLNVSSYAEWLKEAVEKAQQESGAADGDLKESVKNELYFTQRAEVEKSRQRKILFPADEADVEEAPGDSCSDRAGPTQVGDILVGIVKSIEPPKVFVALPVGGGEIDIRDEYIDIYAPLEEHGDVRARVEGFNRKRETLRLKLVGRQTPAPAPGAVAARTDGDDRCSPDTKLAGLKAGPKEKE